MTTKTKIIIALIVVSIIVGISLFFYYRGKNKAAELSKSILKENEQTNLPLKSREGIARDEQIIKSKDSATVMNYIQEDLAE